MSVEWVGKKMVCKELPGGLAAKGPGAVTAVTWVTAIVWVWFLARELLYAAGAAKKN